MNKIAPEGQVFVCAACGKRSKDKYGDQKIDRGWDVSCMLNSVLCYEEKSPETGLYIPVIECDEEALSAMSEAEQKVEQDIDKELE